MQHKRKNTFLNGLFATWALLAFGSASGQMLPPLEPPPELPLVQVPLVSKLPYEYTGNPRTRDIPFLAWRLRDRLASTYTEEEFLVTGTAYRYKYFDDEGQQAYVERDLEAGPILSPGGYTTRLLIRRPSNPEDFNGVVYLEILNATARYDGAPMWNLTSRAMMDAGAAWAGITYSDRSAEFMRDIWGTANFPAPADAKPRNRSRYANLDIPNRAYAWDIVNQAAAALKNQQVSLSGSDVAMPGFDVETIILTGYSQSAGYVTTMLNSFAPAYAGPLVPPDPEDREPLIEGFIVAAPGPNARELDGANSHPVGDRRNCELSFNREAPCIETETEPTPLFTGVDSRRVMRFTTESDIKSVRVRQSDDDQPNLRIYEVAGTSHVDLWGSITGSDTGRYHFGLEPGANYFGSACDLPLNPISTGIPLSAIQENLARWIEDGTEPPASRFIEFTGSFDADTQAWVRDANNNVIGGVRPPRIDVPLGSYYGSNFYSGPTPSVDEIFCTGIIGGFDPFSQEELISRYGNRETLQTLTWWNVLMSFEEGFLLPNDAELILRNTGGLPE